ALHELRGRSGLVGRADAVLVQISPDFESIHRFSEPRFKSEESVLESPLAVFRSGELAEELSPRSDANLLAAVEEKAVARFHPAGADLLARAGEIEVHALAFVPNVHEIELAVAVEIEN